MVLTEPQGATSVNRDALSPTTTEAKIPTTLSIGKHVHPQPVTFAAHFGSINAGARHAQRPVEGASWGARCAVLGQAGSNQLRSPPRVAIGAGRRRQRSWTYCSNLCRRKGLRESQRRRGARLFGRQGLEKRTQRQPSSSKRRTHRPHRRQSPNAQAHGHRNGMRRRERQTIRRWSRLK